MAGIDGSVEHNRPTPTELAVLRAFATGRSTDEVAVLLDLDAADVRAHLADIILQLGVRSKLEAVVLAFRAGWTQDRSDGRPCLV